MEQDREIIKQMLELPGVLMAQFFSENSHKIIDDSLYWNVLGTLWKAGGTVVQQDLWKTMFESKRARRHKIMKGRERKRWRKLPKRIKAYRAVNNINEADTAISWSLSKKTVERVFSEGGTRRVIEKWFDKKDVFAFFDRRNEEEILVNIGVHRNG